MIPTAVFCLVTPCKNLKFQLFFNALTQNSIKFCHLTMFTHLNIQIFIFLFLYSFYELNNVLHDNYSCEDKQKGATTEKKTL